MLAKAFCISQPSISAENNGNYEMCELLVDEIINIGGSAEINPGVDFPLVFIRKT